MGLKEVINDIMEKADEERSAILKEGRKEAHSIIEESKKKIADSEKTANERLEKEAKTIMKKEESGAKLKSHRDVLNAQKEILDEVYAKAKDKIQNLSSADKEKQLKKLFDKAKDSMEPKYVYSNKADKAIVERLAPNLTFKEEINCIGGIIVEDSKQEIIQNYTFDSLFENVKEGYLQQVTEKLFK